MCLPASKMVLPPRNDLAPCRVFPFQASWHHVYMICQLSCPTHWHGYNNMPQISLNIPLRNRAVSTSQNKPLTAYIFQQVHSFLQASPQEIPSEVQD